MAVVDEEVLDPLGGEVGEDRRIEDALGEPKTRRLRAEAPLEPLAHPGDLAAAVLRGDRGEDGFAPSREEELRAARLGHPREEVERTPVAALPPLEERAAHVDCEAQRRARLRLAEEGEVGLLREPADHLVEVAEGLVVVDAEEESHPRRC